MTKKELQNKILNTKRYKKSWWQKFWDDGRRYSYETPYYRKLLELLGFGNFCYEYSRYDDPERMHLV